MLPKKENKNEMFQRKERDLFLDSNKQRKLKKKKRKKNLQKLVRLL